MAKRDKQLGQMKSGERKSFHIVEFSKGKPNEISFDVLGSRSAGNQQKKRFLGGLFFRNKGSAETLTPEDFAHLSSVSRQKDSVQSADTVGFTENASPLVAEESSKRKNKKTAVVDRAKHRSETKTPATTTLFTEASVDKAQQRKNRRRIYGFVSVLVIVLICVGLIGTGGNFLYQKHLEEMSNIELLQESLKEIEKADETIVEIDNFLSAAFDEQTIQKANTYLAEIPQVKSDLQSAEEYAQKANDGLSGSTEDKQASEYALNSIVSRETMLDVANKLLQEDVKAKETIDSLSKAEEKIKEAESLLSQSAQIIANTTEENVNSSTELTTAAKEAFSEALPYCQQAEKAYGDDVAGVYVSYITKRIECCEAALASNVAILLQDRQTAEGYNDQYNNLDKEISEITRVFEKSFFQPIYDEYDRLVKDLKEQYKSLRSSVAVNDGHLRSYLGTDAKNQ